MTDTLKDLWPHGFFIALMVGVLWSLFIFWGKDTIERSENKNHH